MVKLRRNHVKGKGSSNVIRFMIYAVILLVMLWYGLQRTLSNDINFKAPNGEVFYLPTHPRVDVVKHINYTLGYSEEHEQALWVAYILTRDNLQKPNVKRAKRFSSDPSVSTGSAVHSDYTRSGFTRGHLAPAGDMAQDKTAMQESFYMSNMSPQKRTLNNGIWKELEENVRDWAFSRGEIIVITGPIFYSSNYRKIGRNKVGVPDAFYKILLDLNGVEEVISFIIPNDLSEDPLSYYKSTIDEIESVTEIDFFAELLNDELEEFIESTPVIGKWPVSEKRYRLRIEKWNHQ